MKENLKIWITGNQHMNGLNKRLLPNFSGQWLWLPIIASAYCNQLPGPHSLRLYYRESVDFCISFMFYDVACVFTV